MREAERPGRAWLHVRQPGSEADVRPDVAAGAAGVEHALEMQGVVLTGRAHMNAADQLVAPIHAAGELLAEVALAALLGPARLLVLLAALGGRPLGRHRVLLDDFLVVLVQHLLGDRHDARVDHLSARHARCSRDGQVAD